MILETTFFFSSSLGSAFKMIREPPTFFFYTLLSMGVSKGCGRSASRCLLSIFGFAWIICLTFFFGLQDNIVPVNARSWVVILLDVAREEST